MLAALCACLCVAAVACESPTALDEPGGDDEPTTDLAIVPQLSLGQVSSCVLTPRGEVWCWGRVDLSTPTIGVPPRRFTPSDTSVRFAVLAVGTSSCAISTKRRLYCWGSNIYGEVGDGTRTPRLTPTEIAPDQRFDLVAVGAYATCAVSVARDLYCWGRGDFGALADGTYEEGYVRLGPARVGSAPQFTTLMGGAQFCGIRETRQVYCWGQVPGSFDEKARWIDGACTDSYFIRFLERGCARPTPLPDLHAAVGLSVGNVGPTGCVLTPEQQVRCWGDGWLGTLGNGIAGFGVHSVIPEPIQSSAQFRQVTMGSAHACALTVSNEALCWGNNYRGAVGNGSGASGNGFVIVAAPVPVSGGHTFRRIASGGNHVCAMKVDLSVWCWGSGLEGQLGQQDGHVDSSIPIRVNLDLIDLSQPAP